jgi:hypothetical protein
MISSFGYLLAKTETALTLTKLLTQSDVSLDSRATKLCATDATRSVAVHPSVAEISSKPFFLSIRLNDHRQ